MASVKSIKIPFSALAKGTSGMFEYFSKGSLNEYYLGKEAVTVSGEALGLGSQRLARDFGLDFSMGVTADVFDAVMHGDTPDGERHVTWKHSEEYGEKIHVPAYDDCYSPPPEFNIAMLYATEEGRRALLAAHMEATRYSFNGWEADTPACRRGGGKQGQYVDSPGEWMGFAFTHYTSRHTPEQIAAGQAPDLQLHTHVVVPNMAWFDGKWGSLNHKRMVHRVRQARYRYDAHLTTALRDMGYKIEWKAEDRHHNRDWGIAGVEKKLRDLFSSRSKQIKKLKREFEQKYGRPPNWVEEQEIVRGSRAEKDECAEEPDWEAYRERVASEGIKEPDFDNTAPVVLEGSLEERRLAAWMHLQNVLSNSRPTLQRYDFVGHLYTSGVEYLNPEELEDFVNEMSLSDDVVTLDTCSGNSDYDKVTTKFLLERPKSLTRRAVAIACDKIGFAPSVVQRGIALRRLPFKPSEQQKAAFEEFCSSRRFVILLGPGGCGKSKTIVKPSVEAWKWAMAHEFPDVKKRPKVYGISTTGTVADLLAEEIKADGAYTVDQFTLMTDNVPKGSMIFLDELVLTNDQQLDALLTVVEQRDLIVRAAGDFKQLEAIGPAGTWREIINEVGVYELGREEVRRQKEQWLRDALWDIREYRPADAIKALETRGLFHDNETWQDAIGELMQWYDFKIEQGYGLREIMINTDGRNEDIDTINRLCQDVLLRRGRIGGAGFTAASRIDDREETWHAGDRVVFGRTGSGFAYIDTAWVEESYEQIAKLERKKKRDAKSDEIRRIQARCRKAATARNGAHGSILSVHEHGVVVVQLDDGRRINYRADLAGECQALRLAYAGSAYKSQGHQAKAVAVLPYLPVTDLGSAYSMCSRVVEELRVFVGGPDARQRLIEKWSQHDYAQTPGREKINADIRQTIKESAYFDPLEHYEDSDYAAAKEEWDETKAAYSAEPFDPVQQHAEVDHDALMSALDKPAMGGLHGPRNVHDRPFADVERRIRESELEQLAEEVPQSDATIGWCVVAVDEDQNELFDIGWDDEDWSVVDVGQSQELFYDEARSAANAFERAYPEVKVQLCRVVLTQTPNGVVHKRLKPGEFSPYLKKVRRYYGDMGLSIGV